MAAIIPPRQTPNERRVMRRVKAFHCARWCGAFVLLAVAAFTVRFQLGAGHSIWVLRIGLLSGGLAAAAAIAAVAYRIVEKPREVTVSSFPRRPWKPPVIYIAGEASAAPSNNRSKGRDE
jgi:hypothetical protein